MVINMCRLIKRLGMLLLFILLTTLFYIVVSKFLDFINPQFQYKKPSGKVIEVDLRLNDVKARDFKETLY